MLSYFALNFLGAALKREFTYLFKNFLFCLYLYLLIKSVPFKSGVSLWSQQFSFWLSKRMSSIKFFNLKLKSIIKLHHRRQIVRDLIKFDNRIQKI